MKKLLSLFLVLPLFAAAQPWNTFTEITSFPAGSTFLIQTGNVAGLSGVRRIKDTNLVLTLLTLPTWPSDLTITATNVSTTNATTFGVFWKKTGNRLDFLNLVQGSNTVIYIDANSNIVVNATGSASGEVTTGQLLGVSNITITASNVFRTAVTDLQGATNGMTTRLTNLDGATNGLTTRATALETRATNLEGATNGMTTRLTNLDGATNGLTTRATNLEGGTNGLNTRMANVEGGTNGLHNSKLPNSGGLGTNETFRGVTLPSLTASRAAVIDASGNLTNVTSSSPSTEFVRADGTAAVPSGAGDVTTAQLNTASNTVRNAAIANSGGRGTNTALYNNIQIGDADVGGTTTVSNTMAVKSIIRIDTGANLSLQNGSETADRVLYLNIGKNMATLSTVDSTELGFLDGITELISTSIGNLRGATNGLTTRATNLEGATNGLRTDVLNLQGATNGLTTRATSLETRATNLEGATNGLNSETVTNANRLSLSNSTMKPIVIGKANRMLDVFGLEQGANITLTPNGSNYVIAAPASALSDGDKTDITVSGSGATWTIDNDVVSDAKLRESTGFSVIGKGTTGTGNPADIVAGADTVLGRNGSGNLLFAELATGQIANDAVTYAKIQNVTSGRLLGRSSGGAGDTEEITPSSDLSIAGGILGISTTFSNALTVNLGRILFVRTNGSDDTAVIGRVDKAWRNLSNAVLNAVAGDTIDVGQGLHIEPTNSMSLLKDLVNYIVPLGTTLAFGLSADADNPYPVFHDWDGPVRCKFYGAGSFIVSNQLSQVFFVTNALSSVEVFFNEILQAGQVAAIVQGEASLTFIGLGDIQSGYDAYLGEPLGEPGPLYIDCRDILGGTDAGDSSLEFVKAYSQPGRAYVRARRARGDLTLADNILLDIGTVDVSTNNTIYSTTNSSRLGVNGTLRGATVVGWSNAVFSRISVPNVVSPGQYRTAGNFVDCTFFGSTNKATATITNSGLGSTRFIGCRFLDGWGGTNSIRALTIPQTVYLTDVELGQGLHSSITVGATTNMFQRLKLHGALDATGGANFGGPSFFTNTVDVTSDLLVRSPGTFQTDVGVLSALNGDVTLTAGLNLDLLTASSVLGLNATKDTTNLMLSSDFNLTGTTLSLTPVYRTIYVDASAMRSNITAGAVFSIEESQGAMETTNKMVDSYVFDGATSNSVQFKLAMPLEWDLSTVKVKLWTWSTNNVATRTNIWGVSAFAAKDTTVLTNIVWGTERLITNVVSSGGGGVKLSHPTQALTVGNTPAAAGNLVFWRVRRLPGLVDDNDVGQQKLLGAWIQYLESATEAASW